MVHVPIADVLPDFLGETIDNGRLKLIDRLGSGAYGMVYKALDTASPVDSPVYYAVKCLQKQRVGTREGVFQARELKLHKMVSSHPNIVTMHRHFSEGNHIFVVLDFCPGGDLFVAITEQRRFHRNTALVKQAFVQILDAVQYCHGKHQIFHRDLKPENILCDGDTVLLADFGLSTQSGICSDFGLGSPYYMSPEAINAEQVKIPYSCRHADIWALGVILTNMICGRNPWKTAEIHDECYVSYLANNDFLLNALPISPGANDLLKRCFRKHPMARPSVSQLRDEVLKLDTFFLSDEELVHASPSLRAIAQYYADPTSKDECSSHREGTFYDDSNSSRVSSVDPEEVYLYSTPDFDSPWLLLPLADAQFPGASSSVSPSDVSSDSGVASNGPVTPATYPVPDTVEIPDLPEDESIDESAAYPDPAQASEPTRITVPNPDGSGQAKSALHSRSFFKKAMKRIQAIGK
ncbi:serine/threonine protein kinase, negative regulator of sexual conjugation and meiosis [Mycena crocata]|nr:serine/threonine protein kinase, negative regulator of sexual conjugation and meiosis [Mycena crocata]